MQRSILRALSGRQPRQRRGGQRRLERGIPHSQIGFVNRVGRFVAIYEAKTVVSDGRDSCICRRNLHICQLANDAAPLRYKSSFCPRPERGAETDTVVEQSDGCIGVTNLEMEEIWRCVPEGSPIEIRP